MRSQIKGTTAIHRIPPNHAPTLRRQRRPFLGGRETWRELPARVGVVVPSEGILQLLLQGRAEAFEGETRRHVFGLSATRRNDARREHRRERRHALER